MNKDIIYHKLKPYIVGRIKKVDYLGITTEEIFSFLETEIKVEEEIDLDELKEKGFIELIWKRENEEKREIDWTKVPKWTKVLVRNDKDDEWKKAYFLGTSPLGFDTTFSDKFTLNDDHIRIWQYIKLYDENDMKEEWCK